MENQLTQFNELQAEITMFVEPCKSIVVDSNESQSVAMMTAKDIKAWQKKIEERRDSLVRPLNEQVKKINAMAKTISTPLVDAEMHIKKQLGKWNDVLEEKRIAELRRLEEERKKAEAEAAAKLKAQKEEAEAMAMFMKKDEVKKVEIVQEFEAQQAVNEIQEQHEKNVKSLDSMRVSGASRPWVFEVEDAEKVPRAYLMVDEKAIRAAVRAGERNIPGVRVFQETRVAIR